MIYLLFGLLKLTFLEARQLYEELTILKRDLDTANYRICVLDSNNGKAASHFQRLDCIVDKLQNNQSSKASSKALPFKEPKMKPQRTGNTKKLDCIIKKEA